MKIESEWRLLGKIRDLVHARGLHPESLMISIGDDSAVFRTNDESLGLVTTDISIEDIHFRRDFASPEDIGFKAMMGNISDIAAMGGKARYASVSLGISSEISEEYILRIYDGLIDASNTAGAAISGGDISKSPELIISISLYGEVKEEDLITRSGAADNDTIFVTGNIGDSMAGLELLKAGDKENSKRFEMLIERHKRPCARFDITEEIFRTFNPSSMIDISDGLLSDLRHICNESNTGFSIDKEKLPVSRELIEFSSLKNIDPVEYAMHSGEEYELLFTSGKVPEQKELTAVRGIPATPIGEIIDSGFYISGKRIDEEELQGYNHFR